MASRFGLGAAVVATAAMATVIAPATAGIGPTALAVSTTCQPTAATPSALVADPTSVLTASQSTYLRSVAQKTWSYFVASFDPNTGLPVNHLSANGSSAGGAYTTPTDIGLSLDAIAAARDMGLVQPAQAQALAQRVLISVGHLLTQDGFLLAYYDTANGEATATPIGNPVLPTQELSDTADNGWYAQGLLVTEQAFPALAGLAGPLLSAMQWKAVYNPSVGVLSTGIQGGAQQSGTYNLAYSGPRMADLMAMGSGQVPGAVWWRLLDTPPPNVGQRQKITTTPVSYNDPQTGATYTVPESHYVYDGMSFVPTFDGSAFEALAPDQVVPDQAWAPASLGVNDANTVAAQQCVATGDLGYPVWGLAPATTPIPNFGYYEYGAPALSTRLANSPDGAIAPYASFLALNVAPSAAVANIQAVASRYPAVVGRYGFVDSVDPVGGAVAGRYTTFAQGSVMMALDNALGHDAMQNYFASSTYGKTVRPYLQEMRYLVG